MASRETTTSEVARGLHSPLPTRGGFPLVDGVATAFNSLPVVRFDAQVLPLAEAACAAAGACTALRRAVAAADCSFKHVRHLLQHGAVAAAPLCKIFHYVDGAVIHAGRLLSAG